MRGFLARVRNFLGVGIPSHGLGLPPSSQAAPAQPACLGVRFDTATTITMGDDAATLICARFDNATTITLGTTPCPCGG